MRNKGTMIGIIAAIVLTAAVLVMTLSAPGSVTQPETLPSTETPQSEAGAAEDTAQAAEGQTQAAESSGAGQAAQVENSVLRVLKDGQVWEEPRIIEGEKGGLRVTVTLDGRLVCELPFTEACVLSVQQPDGAVNTLTLTGEALRMSEANCDGQDCVMMGEVTPQNLESRVLGGFIICLPHRLSAEVWKNGE